MNVRWLLLWYSWENIGPNIQCTMFVFELWLGHCVSWVRHSHKVPLPFSPPPLMGGGGVGAVACALCFLGETLTQCFSPHGVGAVAGHCVSWVRHSHSAPPTHMEQKLCPVHCVSWVRHSHTVHPLFSKILVA